MNEMDLRVIKTRRALKEAFIELVLENGYESITVRQVAERASVGNKTFYRHFADKRQLAIAIVEEIFGEIIEARKMPTSIEVLEENAVLVLRVVDKHSDFLLRIRHVADWADFVAKQMLVDGVAEVKLILNLSQDATHSLGQPPLELQAYHFVSTLISLCYWWIEHDKPFVIEQMAEYINQFAVRPLLHKR
ncbi:MAG: TetR/AcrR family transcriptional regulator [Chloroflexota bacterium]